MRKLRVLDLFSGIGGFSLGLERTGGFETVAFCEIEEFPRKVLRKHWPDVPIFEDVRKLKGSDVGAIDVICGGYPCQPFSTAGKRRGQEDDRHLWPEFSRLVAELRPAWVCGENVSGHISMGLDDVLSDLEGQGYACRAFVIPACAVDAPHRRDRVWIVGHADENSRQQRAPLAVNHEAEQHDLGGIQDAADAAQMHRHERTQYRQQIEGQEPQLGERDRGGAITDAVRGRQPGSGPLGQPVNSTASEPWETDQFFNAVGWPSEPAICGADDGLPGRLVSARLSALGNAVVPQIPEMIGRAILAAQDRHG